MMSSGSGATLLGLIALEIFLKAVTLVETGHLPSSHDLREIWKKLPTQVRDKLLHEAKDRYPGHTDFSSLSTIFIALKKAFAKGRYSYEINDDRTEAEAQAAGNDWLAEGGAVEEADLAYYPMERDALIHACRKYMKTRQAID